jgi:hypothetical protein
MLELVQKPIDTPLRRGFRTKNTVHLLRRGDHEPGPLRGEFLVFALPRVAQVLCHPRLLPAQGAPDESLAVFESLGRQGLLQRGKVVREALWQLLERQRRHACELEMVDLSEKAIEFVNEVLKAEAGALEMSRVHTLVIFEFLSPALALSLAHDVDALADRPLLRGDHPIQAP